MRKGARTEPPAPMPALRDPRLHLLTAAAGISAMIPVAASFLPSARLWGVNHLAFIPAPLRVAAIVLLALAFVPAVARAVYRVLLRFSARSAGAGQSAAGITAIALIALAAGLGFSAWRSATLLLGDGQLIVRSFEAAEEGHDQVVMRSPRAIMTEEVIAPGTTLLYYAATNVATDRLKKTPLQGMQALNCLLGALFVLILLLAVTGRDIGNEARLWLVLLTLFSCSIELFFGYIENYTTPLLLLFLYVLAVLKALHGRAPLWLPFLPLAAAVYAHVQCVLFVPSYVFLLLWKLTVKRRATLLMMWPTVFGCLALVGIVAGAAVPRLQRFYVPFGFSNRDYALFAPHHLADIVNEVLMLLPIAPLVLALAWVSRGLDARRQKDALRDPGAWFVHPAEWQLIGTILFPCALYLLLFHPEIGMARDWDLFTMATLALVPAVVMILNRYTRATGATGDQVARFAVPALVLTVVTGAAWVAINASEERTVSRFESILNYDATHAAYAWENLAMFHHERGDRERAIDSIRSATEVSRNPRQYVRLAVYLEEAGRMEEAMQVLEDVLVRRPEYTKARFRLLMFLEKKNDWERLLEVSHGGIEHNPDESIYRFFYGMSLFKTGRNEEGLKVFESCVTLDLPEAARKHVEEVLRANGKLK